MRYSNKHLLKPKSVAEHTYEVGRNAAWIAALLKMAGYSVDELAVSGMARGHDEEEVVIGDIISPVKHSPGLEEPLGTAGYVAIGALYARMPSAIRDEAVELWDRYKRQECIESQIVKLADILSGVGECQEERRLGNTTVQDPEKRYLDHYWWAKSEYSWISAIAQYLP